MIKEIFELQNPWRNRPDFRFNQKPRKILSVLLDNLDNKKMIGIVGSRQVGKSSVLFLLIRHLLEKNAVSANDIFYFNLDDLKLHELFAELPEFLYFIGHTRDRRRYIFIDEAQRLTNPGLFLKELYDLGLNLKIFYSGSSQLELKSKTKEHLVGRARVFELYPLSFEEYIQFNAPIPRKQALEEILVYGSYPEVALEREPAAKKLLIKDIFQAYVEKDIADFLKIDNISAFNHLLKLLAMQCGSMMNRESLARSLRVNHSLIERYIQILESTFIIRRVYPFYKNYKKEITKTPKVYFLDLGIRNFILNAFQPVESRTDVGALFENFYFTEILSSDFYGFKKINFWRTTNQTEIDFIIQGEDEFVATEVKWQAKSPPRSFKTIKKYYPDITPRLITQNDFLKE